jgi:hypothetical protein
MLEKDVIQSGIWNREEHTIRKRILPQNTVFCAEQSAIIGAMQSENGHKIVIMDSLSTITAAKSRTPTKNPKTRTIRKMLDNKRTLLWVSSHKEIPGNEKRKEAGRRQKGGYKRNPKERARLRTGYTRATHGLNIEGVRNPLYPKKKQWINGKKGMEKIIEYEKEIGLYNGI